MTSQSCRACGSTDATFLFQVDVNRVVRCNQCTHVFLDIVHTPESIREMYAGYLADERQFYFEIDQQTANHFDAYLGRCKEYCRTGSSALRLLDVGCGNGAFLSRAKKAGFQGEGVETCVPLAEVAERGTGFRVHSKLLSECDFAPASFDVLTMYDLIEHLQDPIEDLRRMHTWLRPGGVLFLLTPNDNAMFRRLSRLAFKLPLSAVKRPMQSLYYPHHLSYFTAASLRSLVQRAGFDVAHLETKNQELSRLSISAAERLAVALVFAASSAAPGSGGKLLAWLRK